MKNIKASIFVILLILSIGFNIYGFNLLKSTKNDNSANISYYEEALSTEINNTKILDSAKEKKLEEEFWLKYEKTEKEYLKSTKMVWDSIKKGVKNNLWYIYNDVRITPIGALSAAKLKGAQEVNKYLNSKGKYNPTDNNGDSLSKFFTFEAGNKYGFNTNIEYKDIAYNVYKIVDFNDDNVKAKEILYDFILKTTDNSIIAKQIKNEGAKAISAAFVDLNNDGIDEIIGYSKNSFFSAKFESEFILFILHKNKNGIYINISSLIPIGVSQPIYILNSKNKGFRNIIFYGSEREMSNQYNLKFEEGLYDFDFDKYLTKNHEENHNKIYFNFLIKPDRK